MSRLIIGSRRHGKTVELIRNAAETGAQIIPSSMLEADRIVSLALDMGYEVWTTSPFGGPIRISKEPTI